MKKSILLLATACVLPTASFAYENYFPENPYKLVAKKKTPNGRLFVYNCSNNNSFEVEQHYNDKTGVEEVRFSAYGNSGKWFTEQITGDVFRDEALNACGQPHIAAK